MDTKRSRRDALHAMGQSGFRDTIAFVSGIFAATLCRDLDIASHAITIAPKSRNLDVHTCQLEEGAHWIKVDIYQSSRIAWDCVYFRSVQWQGIVLSAQGDGPA